MDYPTHGFHHINSQLKASFVLQLCRASFHHESCLVSVSPHGHDGDGDAHVHDHGRAYLNDHVYVRDYVLPSSFYLNFSFSLLYSIVQVLVNDSDCVLSHLYHVSAHVHVRGHVHDHGHDGDGLHRKNEE